MPENNGVTITQAPDPFLDEEIVEDVLDGGDFVDTDDFIDDESLDDDFPDDDDGIPIAVTADPDAVARLDKLEAAARDLAAAEVSREDRRVKRKVAAATTGAGAAGLIPIVLELTNALHLDPTIGMAVAAAAALLGAFAAGWITPERAPSLARELLGR